MSFMGSLWSLNLGWLGSGKGIDSMLTLKLKTIFCMLWILLNSAQVLFPPHFHSVFLLFPHIRSFSVFFLVSISFRMFEPIKLGEVFGTSSLLFTVLLGSYIRISYCSIKCSNKNFASTSEINFKTELETENNLKKTTTTKTKKYTHQNISHTNL